MKLPKVSYINPIILFFAMFFLLANVHAQESDSQFWERVQFGGGLGVSFGNGNFSGSISPSAVYNFNDYVAMGPSLIVSYQSSDFFKSTLYGGSWITLVNPIPAIQLSAELEQLRVNQEIEFIEGTEKDNFWSTALFAGAGYRSGPVTIGLRYNLLHNENDRVYATAWNPFVRVYF
ncbi:hypothetical protein G5B37_08930 [Rasiella rasia]|uniref:Alpha-ketoglutarate decarboxylase n=1 Tax=Rasiella rasia TaxID=2744027 RepID=A0A6G6GMD4_9FLAO|nr:hypothetical protein [Rasiella rasia]QIE59684.1 hypothetical protein G5B37_08930 [Rasiella rasia]